MNYLLQYYICTVCSMIIKKIIIAYGTTGKTKTNRFWSSVKTYKSLNISGLTWSFANMFALLSRRTSMVTRLPEVAAL